MKPGSTSSYTSPKKPLSVQAFRLRRHGSHIRPASTAAITGHIAGVGTSRRHTRRLLRRQRAGTCRDGTAWQRWRSGCSPQSSGTGHRSSHAARPPRTASTRAARDRAELPRRPPPAGTGRISEPIFTGKPRSSHRSSWPKICSPTSSARAWLRILRARLITATLHGMMAQWHLAPGSFSWNAVAETLTQDSRTWSANLLRLCGGCRR